MNKEKTIDRRVQALEGKVEALKDKIKEDLKDTERTFASSLHLSLMHHILFSLTWIGLGLSILIKIPKIYSIAFILPAMFLSIRSISKLKEVKKLKEEIENE